MNIHFILHETFEVPGAYLKWAQDRGHNITSTKVYEEEVLPETVEGIDFLIVMGGPQSPDEDHQTFPYYDPNAEIAFMQKAIAADIYIVGVCLGAQLLSVAYGGKYEHSPLPNTAPYDHILYRHSPPPEKTSPAVHLL